MADVFISLGTNVDREFYLEQGLNALADLFGELTLSSLYESEAVGFAGRPFFNMVIGVSTKLPLAEVASKLRAIEYANGREQDAKKFSPRTLDLDILLYDEVIQDSPVQLPRAEILENAFVLWPLAEIAPTRIHPIANKTYQALWQAYDKSKQQLEVMPLNWQAKNNSKELNIQS